MHKMLKFINAASSQTRWLYKMKLNWNQAWVQWEK